MECMAVLKRPNEVELKTLEDGGFQATLPHKPGTVWQTSRRSCSHVLFIVLVMTLLLVLFMSQLMLYTQVQELRKQLKENEKRFKGIAEQVESEKQLMNSRHTKTHWKNRERNEQIRRHVDQPIPGFVYRGSGLAGDGMFRWDRFHNESFDLGDVSDFDGYRFKVQVSGMYFVTVQINVQGRRSMEPVFKSVTFWVCRQRELNNGTWEEKRLDKVVLTQDDGGRITYASGGSHQVQPVDSMAYSGMFYLKRYDRLYVRRPLNEINDNTVIFDNSAESGHFSAHLIVRE